MKLKSVRIENFKSIDDSSPFTVGAITCLVGKNESGKSAILEALYKFNPIIEADAKLEPPIEYYPRRRWNKYRDHHEAQPDNVLTTVWQVEAEDAEAVNEHIGHGTFSAAEIQVEKGYANKRQYSKLGIAEDRVVKHCVSVAGLHEEEANALRDLPTIQDVRKALSENPSKSDRETALLASLTGTFAQRSAAQTAVTILDGRLPKFIYFNDYDRLPGQVPLTTLLQKQHAAPQTLTREDRIFLALLDLAGTDAEDIQKTGKFEELKAELEAIQNSISDEIFRPGARTGTSEWSLASTMRCRRIRRRSMQDGSFARA